MSFGAGSSELASASTGFIPGSQSGLNPEFASQRIGSSIERIASVMCAKSIVPDLVRRLVILLVQAEARHRVRDDAAAANWMLSERVKKLCSGCGSCTSLRALLGERRSERRALVAGQPQRVRRHLAVRAADHLELQVGDDRAERHDWTIGEEARAEPARFLAAEEREDDRALRTRAERQRPRQLQHRHTSRRVIVGAVEDRVGAGARCSAAIAAPMMIEVRGEQNDLGGGRGIAAGQPADGVPRLRPWSGLDLGFDRDRRAFGQRRNRAVGVLGSSATVVGRRGGRAVDADKPRRRRRQPRAGWRFRLIGVLERQHDRPRRS